MKTKNTPRVPSIPRVDARMMKWVLGEISSIEGTNLIPYWENGGAPDLDFGSLPAYIHSSRLRALVSKNAHLGFTRDTALAALEQTLIDESRCSVTNERLVRDMDHKTAALIQRIRGFLTVALRPFWRHLSRSDPRMGPGVAILANGKSGYSPDKLLNPYSTLKLTNYMQKTGFLTDHPFFFAWLTHDTAPAPADAISKLSLEQFFTVPKDCVTDRGCSKQPAVNMAVQLMVGQALRECLKPYGILTESITVGRETIGDQACYHRQILPTMWDEVATIDLKSASNTIAYELVRLVLPDDVFELLDACRCSSLELPNGDIHELERFSAMGNGFTFELETLLFYSIASISAEGFTDPGLRSGLASVFGDDIIVHKDAFSQTTTNLELLGFEINIKKSFASGPFRESCGMDVYEGVPVRPVFLKDLSGVCGFITLHNLVLKLARFGDGPYDRRYRRLLTQMRERAKQVPLGPVRDGDDTYFHEPTFSSYSARRLVLTRKSADGSVTNDVLLDTNQMGFRCLRLKTKKVNCPTSHYLVYMWMYLQFDSAGYQMRNTSYVSAVGFKARIATDVVSFWV